ncbi:hypothetical protein AQUCO_01200218v1 [Aquilegia coerulea]|uniref:Cytochrome P450 n=1 Tax=Aquilegia coerulea TaxID=218851 RepID=A0A2G5E5H8_AQUCA|nr:hypothetical protein AQUCO_01200218v1 [Aquilegia coerulea]
MALPTLPLKWLALAKHQENLFYQYPFVFTLIFISFTFILLKLITGSFSEKLNLPPSPPRLPILGNIHQLGLLLHRSLHNLSQKYGPLMYLRLGYSDVLVVSSAEMAREIKINHEIPFGNRPSTTSTRMLFYGPKDMAFSPYGDYWRQVRKISVLEIFSNKKVDSFKSVREEEVALLINKISNLASMKTPVNITESVINVVNDIMWAMAELVNNPHVMQKAREEVRRVVGKKNKVEEEDIQQMEFLKGVVKESLRLHPPAALLPMETSTITNVNGYHIPAKTKVHINIWSIHMDPNLWERPEEFIPERFINSPINFSGQDFKYIPFGSGRRICPGILFGTTAVELVIANLLYWFDWETPGGEKLDMAESFGLSVIKKLPYQLLPIPISHLG